MKMKPDIKNMTINEYIDYEAEKGRRLWDNVRSKSSPTSICEQDVDLEKEEAEDHRIRLNHLLKNSNKSVICGLKIKELMIMNYQIKVNLTAPKLTFHGIEDEKLYKIIALPFVGLIYENSKKERRVMDIDEIPKFCDATLDVKHGYKDPPLGNQDADLMRFYDEHI
nr:hypothetical protein [Tanacetum cinerariifolium]